MSETIAQPTGVILVDWSNIWRGWEEMNYPPAEIDLEAGFDRLDKWLSGICQITRRELYAPKRDTQSWFEFLAERGYAINQCPMKVVPERRPAGIMDRKSAKSAMRGALTEKRVDTTDEKLIVSAIDLIARYAMDYLFIGSGDHGFADAMKTAKARGIKTGIVYGSDSSLSTDLYHLADPHPTNGNPMLHLFAPTVNPP